MCDFFWLVFGFHKYVHTLSYSSDQTSNSETTKMNLFMFKDVKSVFSTNKQIYWHFVLFVSFDTQPKGHFLSSEILDKDETKSKFAAVGLGV